MNKESAVLDRELERDARQPERRAGRTSSDPAVAPDSAAHQSSSKRSLGNRIKGALSSLAKALEGDHGTQHYRS